MSGPSSIDSLRRLASISDAEAAGIFGVAGREELLAGVASLPVGRAAGPGKATRRRRPLVLAVAAVAAAVTAAGAWAILGSSAQQTTSIECAIQGADTIIPASSGDPARDCAVQWQRDEGAPAPPLRAYDNTHGGVTVLPRSETPPSGWKRLVSGQNVDLIRLQDSLDDYLNGLNSACLGSAPAVSLTRSKLAQLGFTGWTVTTKNPPAASGSGVCWSTNVVDPGAQSVTLMPAGLPSGLAKTSYEKLAAKLRPFTRSCESLPKAVAAVRAAAGSLGLSEAARTYELNATTDNTLRCAAIYETVGGTIFLTLRGPSG